MRGPSPVERSKEVGHDPRRTFPSRLPRGSINSTVHVDNHVAHMLDEVEEVHELPRKEPGRFVTPFRPNRDGFTPRRGEGCTEIESKLVAAAVGIFRRQILGP